MLSQFHYLIGHYSLKFLHPLFIEISIFFFDKCILKKYIIVRILKFFNNRFRVFLNSCSFYIVNTSFNLLKKNKRQKIFVSKYIKKIASIIKNKNLKYTQSIMQKNFRSRKGASFTRAYEFYIFFNFEKVYVTS